MGGARFCRVLESAGMYDDADADELRKQFFQKAFSRDGSDFPPGSSEQMSHRFEARIPVGNKLLP